MTGLNSLKRDRQRTIRLLLKGEELLRHAVFEHADIFSTQRRHETPLFVHCSERKIGNVGLDANDVVVLVRGLIRSLRVQRRSAQKSEQDEHK